jgi:trans-aconitate methyltransferase
VIINMSHLKKNYTIEDMSYLDGNEASVLYNFKANLIKDQYYKKVVDVGCRTGEINKYLTDYDYLYYGFDTSSEPIEYAKQQYPSKFFELRDWNNLRYLPCDVIVFGSVLVYAQNPIEMFERICNFYKPKCAIVHEVNNKNTEQLTYTNLNYFEQYETEIYEFELNIPVKHRTILNVKL